jgi:hypothetical protein
MVLRALLFVVLSSPVAAAQTVTARLGEGPFVGGPIQARIGERVELRVDPSPPPGAQVRWLRVVPRMQHRDTPPPNEGIAQYSNSVLFGPSHGRWIGLDRVEYEVAPLATGRRLVLDAALGPDGEPSGPGTVFIAAEVERMDGTVLRTPDATATDRLGLRSEVMRVSFRASDDFLGWLGTYFHVPNIFGSIGPQADRYIGADCADVLVGALRASGARRIRYTSVGGIGQYARAVSGELFLEDGAVRDGTGAEVRLRWGEHVERGDLLAIDYVRAGATMPRAWDHIGALVGDRAGRGVAGLLDGADLLRHMTPRGLVDLPIQREGRIRFRVWRWRQAHVARRD